MDIFDVQFLNDVVIGNLLERANQVQWIKDLGVQANTIANFGCNQGTETIGLMYAFNAKRATGFDIDEENIYEANLQLNRIKEAIERIDRHVRYYPETVPPDIKNWWEKDVSLFLKRDIFQQDFNLSFRLQDITKPLDFPDSSCDLAYCNFVLHHIWWDANREDGEAATYAAITEMARITKSGGYVAARELVRYANQEKLSFESLFKRAGLIPINVKEIHVEGVDGEYQLLLYRKP